MGRTVDLDAAGFLRSIGESVAIPLVFVLAAVAEWAKLTGLLPVFLRLP